MLYKKKSDSILVTYRTNEIPVGASKYKNTKIRTYWDIMIWNMWSISSSSNTLFIMFMWTWWIRICEAYLGHVLYPYIPVTYVLSIRCTLYSFLAFMKQVGMLGVTNRIKVRTYIKYVLYFKIAQMPISKFFFFFLYSFVIEV